MQQVWSGLTASFCHDDVETSILRGLKFPDAWTVTGVPDTSVLRDEWGNDWRDITR